MDRFTRILLAVGLIELADQAIELIEVRLGDKALAERLKMVKSLNSPGDANGFDLETAKSASADLGFGNDNEFKGWYCLVTSDFDCALEAMRAEAGTFTSEFSNVPFFESSG